MEFKPKDLNKYFRYQELLRFLQETDYKVVKCFEAFIANEKMPYDFDKLKSQRKAWRDEINQLEEEYNG
jgi:hypothetical protein